MTIVLRIPDLVDTSLAELKSQISSLQTRVNTMNNDLNAIKTRGAAASPSAPGPATVSSPKPVAAPGGPPPPPGGPPGGPPPGPSRPASPQSLRGAIMGELKQLFAKRSKK
jgi:hypothetical protein